MEWIAANYLEVGKALLALLGFFSIVANLTPTQSDNKILAKILSVVHAIGLTKKEEPK